MNLKIAGVCQVFLAQTGDHASFVWPITGALVVILFFLVLRTRFLYRGRFPCLIAFAIPDFWAAGA